MLGGCGFFALFKHSSILFTFLCLCEYVIGRVEIINPYAPFYVQSGAALNLVCQSRDQTKIKWIQRTPQSAWNDSEIVPVAGQDFIIRDCTEKPGTLVQSTLIRSDMSLNSRGMYQCEAGDDSSSFAVWVTVLYVNKQIVTNTKDTLILNCTINGFDSNLPTMDYDWTFNDKLIPHPHDQSAAALAVHSEDELASNSKYTVTLDNGVSSLVISKPVASDGGTYNCSFTLGTNLGRLTFSESLYVNGSSLHQTSESTLLRMSFYSLLVMTLLVMSVTYV